MDIPFFCNITYNKYISRKRPKTPPFLSILTFHSFLCLHFQCLEVRFLANQKSIIVERSKVLVAKHAYHKIIDAHPSASDAPAYPAPYQNLPVPNSSHTHYCFLLPSTHLVINHSCPCRKRCLSRNWCRRYCGCQSGWTMMNRLVRHQGLVGRNRLRSSCWTNRRRYGLVIPEWGDRHMMLRRGNGCSVIDEKFAFGPVASVSR